MQSQEMQREQCRQLPQEGHHCADRLARLRPADQKQHCPGYRRTGEKGRPLHGEELFRTEACVDQVGPPPVRIQSSRTDAIKTSG